MSYPPAHGLAYDDYDSDAEDETCSISSATLFSPPRSVSGSSCTSYDVSMRSASPTPSVFSMTSSLRAQAFKHEFGRGINNYSEVYRLPADDPELERLGMRFSSLFSTLRSSCSRTLAEKQHLMFKEVMGNYPPPMYEVMVDDVPGETKTCLDLGCGAGNWYVYAGFLECRFYVQTIFLVLGSWIVPAISLIVVP